MTHTYTQRTHTLIDRQLGICIRPTRTARRTAASELDHKHLRVDKSFDVFLILVVLRDKAVTPDSAARYCWQPARDTCNNVSTKGSRCLNNHPCTVVLVGTRRPHEKVAHFSPSEHSLHGVGSPAGEGSLCMFCSVYLFSFVHFMLLLHLEQRG
eukprot:3751515-Amphidinium_carterae.1